MSYLHAITTAANFELATMLYAPLSLLVSVLVEGLLLGIERMGFGRRGGFGRGLGAFRVLRIVIGLLFTTLLGPIVVVALIAFVAYRFFASRRRQ